MHNVMQEFDSSIRMFESDRATVIDVYSVMNRLRSQLITRHTDKFIEEQKNHRYLQQRETPSTDGRLVSKAYLCMILLFQHLIET